MVLLAVARGMTWGAVVLAGGTVEPKMAEVIGTDRKALAVCAGRTCLARTLNAVRDAGLSECVTVGPELVRAEVHHGRWVEERGRQMQNAKAGVDDLVDCENLLFLPSDSPLLTGSGILHFLTSVEAKTRDNRWLSAGVCPEATFIDAYPEVPTQAIRIRDGRFISGAYYAASKEAFYAAMDIVAEMSESRKSQIKMIGKLGLGTVLRYFTGQLWLADGEARVSRLMNAHAFAVTDCDPESMVDIDTPEDWQAVQKIFARRPA